MESDSIRAELVEKLSKDKVSSKSTIVATISMYVATKLGSAEIGLIVSGVIVVLSKVAQRLSISTIDAFCKTLNGKI